MNLKWGQLVSSIGRSLHCPNIFLSIRYSAASQLRSCVDARVSCSVCDVSESSNLKLITRCR